MHALLAKCSMCLRIMNPQDSVDHLVDGHGVDVETIHASPAGHDLNGHAVFSYRIESK